MRIGIAVVALSVGLGASAASAQPGWYGYGYGYRYGSPYGEPYGPGAHYASLPRHRLMSAVRDAGLRPVSHPMRAGRNYIVDAVDRRGDLKRVVIDGYYGEVVRIASVTRPDYPRPYSSRRGEDGPRANAPIDLDLPGRPPPRASEQPPGPRPQARVPSEPEVVGPDGPSANDPDIYEDEPPMRPRARIPGAREPGEAPNGPIPNAEIPPPPAPRIERNAVKPAPAKPERKTARTNNAAPSASPNKKPRVGDGESAAVNPSQPPLPRARPGAESGEEAVAAPDNKPAAAAQTASPRVVLPGGPTRRTNDASAPAARNLDSEKPPTATQPPAAILPPMQSLD